MEDHKCVHGSLLMIKVLFCAFFLLSYINMIWALCVSSIYKKPNKDTIDHLVFLLSYLREWAEDTYVNIIPRWVILIMHVNHVHFGIKYWLEVRRQTHAKNSPYNKDSLKLKVDGCKQVPTSWHIFCYTFMIS